MRIHTVVSLKIGSTDLMVKLSEYRAKQVLGRWYPPPPMYFTPKRPMEQTASSPKSSASSGSSSTSTSDPPAPVRIEIFGRSLKERRRALAAARIRIAHERLEAAADIAIPLPAPLPPPTIHDYKGWYKLLGVQPDTDYLQPSRNELVTQQLKARRVVLAMRYHRDRGGNDMRMTQLNLAWDQLKKVEGRIEYYHKKL